MQGGSSLQRLRKDSTEFGSQGGSQRRGAVRLHGTPHASQKAPCTRDAAKCDLVRPSPPPLSLNSTTAATSCPHDPRPVVKPACAPYIRNVGTTETVGGQRRC